MLQIMVNTMNLLVFRISIANQQTLLKAGRQYFACIINTDFSRRKKFFEQITSNSAVQ